MNFLVYSLLCVIWGFSWVAIKITLAGFSPLLGAGIRFLVAVPFLLTYAWLRGRKLWFPAALLPMMLCTAFLTYGISYGLIYWAEQYLSAGVTAVFFATFPLFTGLYSHLVLRSELLRVNVYLGLAIGFLGVGVVYVDELRRTPAGWLVLASTGAVVLGAAGGALATVLIKQHLSTLHPVTLTVHQSLIGGVGLLLGAALTGESFAVHWTLPVAGGLLYLGVIASALAFSLYYWLLQRVSAVTLSTMIYLTPLVALFGDWLVYGATLTLQAVAGMGLIFLGVAVAELPRYRKAVSGRV